MTWKANHFGKAVCTKNSLNGSKNFYSWGKEKHSTWRARKQEWLLDLIGWAWVRQSKTRFHGSSHDCSTWAGEGAGGKGEFAHLMRPGGHGIGESCQKSTSMWSLDMLQEMELFRSNVKIVGWAVDLGVCSLMLLSRGHGHSCSNLITKWKKNCRCREWSG